MPRVYVLCSEDVLHPETRKRILMAGDVYTSTQLDEARQKYGVDNVKGHAIVADNFDDAMVVAMRIAHA